MSDKKPWDEEWHEVEDTDLPYIEMGSGIDFVLPDPARRKLVVAAPALYRTLLWIEQRLQELRIDESFRHFAVNLGRAGVLDEMQRQAEKMLVKARGE